MMHVLCEKVSSRTKHGIPDGHYHAMSFPIHSYFLFTDHTLPRRSDRHLRSSTAVGTHRREAGTSAARCMPPSRHERLLAELDRCARALRELADEPEPPTDDAADFSPAIPVLVGLLTAGPDAAGNAAWAFARLTSASAAPRLCTANKIAIRAASGIPPLVSLLKVEKSAKAADASAGALQNIGTHSSQFNEAVLAAIVAERPQIDKFTYLGARVRPVAMKRMRRLEGGVDAIALERAIDAAEVVGVDAVAVQDARARLAELPAERQKRRETLGLSGVDTPVDHCCPITAEVMVDPVIASDGHSYEREALMQVIDEGNGLSPLTREPLAPQVIPNRTLLKRIRAWDEEVLRAVELSTKSRGIVLD